MKALPLPCEMTTAKAINAQATLTSAGGARSTTDSMVRLRIYQCAATRLPTIRDTVTT